MERHAQGTGLLNTLNNLFRRAQSSLADEQVDPVQRAGVVHTQVPSSPIQLGQGVEATSFSGPTALHSHAAADRDVPMFLADPPNDTPHSTGHPAHITSSSPQLISLPPTGAFATSSLPIALEELGPAHSPIVDDDARSDISMPPLVVESDLEYEEDHVRYGGYDSLSESDADAYDVEMTLLADDGDLSDGDSALLNENTPLPSTPSTADRNQRQVTFEEVEDQDQQRPDSTPLVGSGQPVSSSHGGTHSHWHPHHHHHHPHPHHPQHPHPPHSPHPDGDVRLPNFPTMPGLRAQGQVEGQVPLPGLRTLFQPLIVEAIAQASERFRTAQGAGGPAAGQNQGQGPTMGPAAPGAPIVQVTFDVPMFRVPRDVQTRQQPQAEAQPGSDGQRRAEHERAFAAPPSPDNLNFTTPTPNPIPTATDTIPPMLRQIFEATFDAEPADPPTADGPQIGAPPGWAGLMGLLFGLGLGASSEFNREDPARAKRLVKGLEAVNAGLVKRMGKISEGNADGAICAICWDALLEEHMENTPDWAAAEEALGDTTSNREQPTDSEGEASDSAEPEFEPEEPLPKIIALPCSHVFHSTCLVPWFSRPRQTTCPTCRFNVDPENLTYEPPRRPQSSTRQQSQQERPQPAAPQEGEQQQQESGPRVVPPPQQTPQQQDGHPPHPPLRRTIFEHTFTIPFSPPLFPFGHPPPGNPVPQPQPEMRQQGPGQHGPFPTPPAPTDPFSHIAFQRTIHNLRRPFTPHTQTRMQMFPNGVPAPAQEGSTLPHVPLQPQIQPPLPGQGMQLPPLGGGQQNTNGMPRFPGLFQFQLPSAPAQVPLQPQMQPPMPGHGMQPPPPGDSQQNTNGMPRFPGLFQFQLPSAPPQVPLQPQMQPPMPGQGMQPPPPGDGQQNTNGLPRFPELFQFQLPSAPPQVPLQPQMQPPLPGQGMQPPPPGDGQQNMNGMPRFPGLFQFQLPQFVRMPDGSWFWSAPLGGFPSPPTATSTTNTSQAAPGPAAPKRPWVAPPPPGLTLRQRVEQGERDKGLRCDDISCGLGPSDDDPEPTADLARVVIHSLDDGASVCGHTFHPACLVSAERVAGWGPDSEGERKRAGGLVEVSCPVCRAVGVVRRKDWEQGAQALA